MASRGVNKVILVGNFGREPETRREMILWEAAGPDAVWFDAMGEYAQEIAAALRD